MNLFKLFFICLTFLTLNVSAQHENQTYVTDPNPLIQQRIEEWKDIKFGLLMHWGPYSQWGIVESWSICPEDEGWCIPDTVKDYFHYKKQYENLGKTFNPTKFDPERWAKAAKNAGMKYVVFTTKHHDGFCMFDSKYTDYKITGKDSPFRTNAKADVTKEIFKAFRNEGFWIGAYFSKPDWHSTDYWWPQFPPLDRNVNYDPAAYPERWNNFVNFTHNQVMEICSNYGKIDLMWFDGGWVQKHPDKGAAPEVPGFKVKKYFNQDIKMDELVSKIRSKQPDCIVVDRSVEGKNQNYLTPENQVPDKMLPYPWESCMILGGGWSYSFNAKMMPTRKAIHMLTDIVAKGGNLLLNIGPGSDGTWYEEAYSRLNEIGDWLKINGEAIYGTRTIAPYYDGKLRFTRCKDGSANIIYLLDENEKLPAEIQIKGFTPEKGAKIALLGKKGSSLKWKADGSGFKISIPENQTKTLPSTYAVVFKVSAS
ncbi:MAG TPA: alpha-L-fucosidase [Prolixibacteraceae bacterium]|nr:alpha-L-fucosidase [Prolixibacteraceae bacterium]